MSYDTYLAACYTRGMEANAPEPGFVPAYRLFVVIQILFWLAVGPVLILLELAGDPMFATDPVVGERLIRSLSLPAIMPLLMLEILLLALLVWPEAQRLGRWFVPLTLGLGLIPLLVGYYVWPADNPLQSPFVMFFFVMAMLIAWEYKYRYLYLFVIGLTLYQVLVSPAKVNVPWTVPVGFQVLQAVMMLLAGYVTATLATVQASQRAALSEAYQRQAAANERLKQYTATLEELTISRERNRLARELHDTLAHSLSAVTVQLEAVQALWTKQPDKARHILEQANETARTGLAEAAPRPAGAPRLPLEDLGLPLALRELAETAAQRTGAQLTAHVPASMSGCVPRSVEQGVYRIAQETLENVVRHTGARKIAVELFEAPDSLVLTVQDDGQGIDAERLNGAEDDDDRLGIRGMPRTRGADRRPAGYQRSAAGQGTRVTLTVPIEKGADDSCPDL